MLLSIYYLIDVRLDSREKKQEGKIRHQYTTFFFRKFQTYIIA